MHRVLKGTAHDDGELDGSDYKLSALDIFLSRLSLDSTKNEMKRFNEIE